MTQLRRDVIIRDVNEQSLFDKSIHVQYLRGNLQSLPWKIRNMINIYVLLDTQKRRERKREREIK